MFYTRERHQQKPKPLQQRSRNSRGSIVHILNMFTGTVPPLIEDMTPAGKNLFDGRYGSFGRGPSNMWILKCQLYVLVFIIASGGEKESFVNIISKFQ